MPTTSVCVDHYLKYHFDVSEKYYYFDGVQYLCLCASTLLAGGYVLVHLSKCIVSALNVDV